MPQIKRCTTKGKTHVEGGEDAMTQSGEIANDAMTYVVGPFKPLLVTVNTCSLDPWKKSRRCALNAVDLITSVHWGPACSKVRVQQSANNVL